MSGSLANHKLAYGTVRKKGINNYNYYDSDELTRLGYHAIHLRKEEPRHRTGLDLDGRVQPRKLHLMNCRDLQVSTKNATKY